MTTMKDATMHFDFEGFGERNAIRSALCANPPGSFDGKEVLRLLRLVPLSLSRRGARGPEQARAA